MRCFVLLTLVAGLSGQPIDSKKSYVNRDLAFLVIPVEPGKTAFNSPARSALTTTKGVFYVRETPEEVMSARCVENQDGRSSQD